MPTGYTNSIQSGEVNTFADFATLCSRAFGAHIMSRDEENSLDKTPKKYEPDTYHRDRRDGALAKLAYLASFCDSDLLILAQHQINRERRALVISAKKHMKDASATKVKYGTMLLDAMTWRPPTEEHLKLKDFMVNQIVISAGDCDVSYWTRQLAQPVPTPEEWLKNAISQAETDVVYHDKEWEEELGRTAARNLWISQLAESLSVD